MDRRTVIGMLACVVFYIAYSYYLQKRFPDYGKPQQIPQEQTASPSESANPATITDTKPAVIEPAAAAPSPSIVQLDEKELSFKTDVFTAQFEQNTASLKSLVLNLYLDDAKKASQRRPLDIVKGENLTIQPLSDAAQNKSDQGYAAERLSDREIRFTKADTDWLKAITYTFTEGSYTIDIDVSFQNTSTATRPLNAGLLVREGLRVDKAGFSLIPSADNHYQRLIAGVNGSKDNETLSSFCNSDKTDPALTGQNEKVDFVGFDHHYFLAVFSPESEKFNFVINKDQASSTGSICQLYVSLTQPQGDVKANETVRLKFKGYFGPKDVDILAKENGNLKEALDLGWFSLIGRPLLVTIKAFNEHLTFNYGLAIILLTICLKILFFPLTKAAAISMKKMQVYTPEINRIKEKYKDDRQAQQREMMAFLAKHKINPAKGCLPILPQIPVFIAFYNVLSQSIELRHAPFFGWIQDLSAADPYYITPLLLGVGMFIQQKMTPNPTMDPAQQRILMIMPIMFTFMMLSLPAGMVLYMITNTIVSILQQQWLNKHLKVDVKVA